VNIRGSIKWNFALHAHLDYSNAAIKSTNKLIETGKKVNRTNVIQPINAHPALKRRKYNRLEEVDTIEKETKLTAHD